MLCVWGGYIERVTVKRGQNSAQAEVLFLDRDDMVEYYKDTENGIAWPHDPPSQSARCIVVKEVKAPEPFQHSHWIEKRSRVIRINAPFPKGITVQNLKSIAGRLGYVLECIHEATYTKNRTMLHFIEIRFTSIDDAHAYITWLNRHPVLYEAGSAGKFRYCEDPCLYRLKHDDERDD
jgi:hypothetical protein